MDRVRGLQNQRSRTQRPFGKLSLRGSGTSK
jgi:hypothetical protein